MTLNPARRAEMTPAEESSITTALLGSSMVSSKIFHEETEDSVTDPIDRKSIATMLFKDEIEQDRS